MAAALVPGNLLALFMRDLACTQCVVRTVTAADHPQLMSSETWLHNGLEH